MHKYITSLKQANYSDDFYYGHRLKIGLFIRYNGLVKNIGNCPTVSVNSVNIENL